jgi:WD40 repeat protein
MYMSELRIWDGQQPDRLLLAADFDASAMAFAPDGKGFAVLSFRGSEAISLWSWPAGRLLRRLTAPGCHQNEATLAYLNGGSHLLANSRSGAAIYDIASGAATPVKPFNPTVTKRLAEIERDLAKVAAFFKGMTPVKKWTDDMERLQKQSIALERERAGLIGDGGTWQIATARDGALIIVLVNDYLASRPPSVCDPSTGQWLRTCEDRHPIAASSSHQTQATLTSSIAGNRISVVRRFHLPNGTRTESLTVWDADTGLELGYLERPVGLHGSPVLLPDDSALIQLPAAIGRWRWASGEVEPFPIAMGGRFCDPTPLDAHGKRIAWNIDRRTMRILDRETGLLTTWNAGGRTEICDTASLAIGPGGRLVAAASSDCRIALWDLAEARMRAQTEFGKPSKGGSEWTHLAFASDGRSVHLLQGSSSHERTSAELGRWALDDSTPETWWSDTLASGVPYQGLAINGHWAAALDGRGLRRFDLLAQGELPRIPLPDLLTIDKCYRGLSSLSDAGLIQLCGDPSRVHCTALYDLRTGSRDPVAGGGPVATSPDGQWRLATSDTATELQELPTGRVVASLPTARSLSFADDSRCFLLITRTGLGIGTIPTAQEPLKMQACLYGWLTTA